MTGFQFFFLVMDALNAPLHVYKRLKRGRSEALWWQWCLVLALEEVCMCGLSLGALVSQSYPE